MVLDLNLPTYLRTMSVQVTHTILASIAISYDQRIEQQSHGSRYLAVLSPERSVFLHYCSSYESGSADLSVLYHRLHSLVASVGIIHCTR